VMSEESKQPQEKASVSSEVRDRRRGRLDRELEALDRRYQLWTQRLNQLSEARAIENDAATIVKQDCQISETQAAIDRLKSKIELLEEQLISVFDFLSPGNEFNQPFQLTSIDLDFLDISEDIIQQAYQDSLPPDAGVWGLPGNSISEKIDALEQFGRLSEFFTRLIEDRSLPSAVRDRFQEIAKQLAAKKPPEVIQNKSSPKSDGDRIEQLKSYLITTIEPYDGNFILNAWLIFHDPFQDFSSFQSQELTRFEPLIDPNEKQAGILCNLNRLPTEFSKLLQKAVALLRRKKHHLTIEFFLPSNLMCVEVDRWKIKINDLDEIILGTKYPVRLRSTECLNPGFLDYNWHQWCENWDKVRDVLKEKPVDNLFEHLQEITNFNAESFTYKLIDKIGIKLTCAHPQSMRKDLFRAIRLSTTPIAIWIRTDISNLDRVTEIDKVLTSQPLGDLCKSVQKIRVQAHAQQAEEHLGLHLAILWENPYRLTPDVMLELMQAGQ
jgi:hypothetical protein